MRKRKTIWRWWAKALGEKTSKCDRESDRIAIIRTLIFAFYLITNGFIIAGVIRNWNRSPTIIIQREVSSHLSESKEKGIFKTDRSFLYD